MISSSRIARNTTIAGIQHWAKAQTCGIKLFWLFILTILFIVSFYQSFKCYRRYSAYGVMTKVSVSNHIKTENHGTSFICCKTCLDKNRTCKTISVSVILQHESVQTKFIRILAAVSESGKTLCAYCNPKVQKSTFLHYFSFLLLIILESRKTQLQRIIWQQRKATQTMLNGNADKVCKVLCSGVLYYMCGNCIFS